MNTSRLLVVAHEVTTATHTARFAGHADQLSVAGETAATREPSPSVGSPSQVLVGPESRCVSTARLRGFPDPVTDPRLADLDVGDWAGRERDGIDDHDLLAWLSDPAARPHGGESLEDFRDRTAGVLDSIPTGSRTVLVAHPATIRAALLVALDAPTASFWRVDAGPGHELLLHGRPGRWTVRLHRR